VPQVVKCRVFGELRGGDGGLPDLTVEVVATQQGAAGLAAQNVLAAKPKLMTVLGDGREHERWHGHVSKR
jgi:hypothetical protein